MAEAEGAANRGSRRDTESFYRRWQTSEEIPVHQGSFVPDLHTVELGFWPRIGQKAAFVNLAEQEQDDGWVIEVAPAGQTEVIHHAFEALIYVVEGRGATTLWQEGKPKQTVEWQRGSILSPPLNCSYQHFNLDGNQPARLFHVTTAPVALNFYHDVDFVFQNPYVFRERYNGEEDYFTRPGERMEGGRGLRTNFIPDMRGFSLDDSPGRGTPGNTNTLFVLANNESRMFCSQYPSGTYKRAHRHGVGAHIVILDGDGYSLLWFEGEERRRVDWTDGTVFSPKEWQYHQHFNSGPKPARYFAFLLGGLDTRRPEPGRAWNTEEEMMGIPFQQEDPAIHDLYEQECARHGATVVMPRPNYTSG